MILQLVVNAALWLIAWVLYFFFAGGLAVGLLAAQFFDRFILP